MKYIISLLLSLFAYTVYARQPVTYSYDITPAVTIYLTDDPCTMFSPPTGVTLFKAYAEDTITVDKVEGCWTRGENNKVEVKLLNLKDKKFYDFVLPEALFKQEANI
jgi:hypothetical protein